MLTTTADTDLLPRLHGYLESSDPIRVELGVALVWSIRHPSTVPLLKKIITSDKAILRGKALRALGEYNDPRFLPIFRRAIADRSVSVHAIRALEPMARHSAVRQLIEQLLKDPTHVTVAKEVARSANMDVSKIKVAVSQGNYYKPAAGFEIGYLETWQNESHEDYEVRFVNEEMGAWYGVQLRALDRPTRSDRLLGRIEQARRLRNTLAAGARPVSAALLRVIGADSGTVGSYRPDDKSHFLMVVLTKETRAYLIIGKTPARNVTAFNDVFQRLWPTMRISQPRVWDFKRLDANSVTLEVK